MSHDLNVPPFLTNMSAYTELSSLSEIAADYDVFLIDLWGVTHNGEHPFQSAIAVYEKLKAMGKTLIILSNAPRLPAITLKRLSEMGISPALFDDVMTSGLECHTMLRERVHPFHGTLGLNLFHIGPERDRTVFDTLPYVCVESIAAADFLLITGTDGWEETADAYHDRLQAALDCGLPALCANADKTVFIGNSQVICAGAIAEVYRTMIRATNGGANEAEKLYIHGKPDAGLFKAAHDLANARRGAFTPKSRLLMLGDSLATDIKGANNYGIDSVLAFSGVHKDTSRSDIGVLFDSYQAIPSYVMEQIG